MKKAKLNDVLYYEDQLVKVKGIAQGKMIIMEPVNTKRESCALCNKEHDETIHVLESSPNFQKGAMPTNTINCD